MNINSLFNEKDRAAIAEAVRAVETVTSGEIVPVVANKSSHYFYVELIFAVIFGYILVTVVYEIYPKLDVIYFIPINFLSFIVGICLAKIDSIKRFLIPKNIKNSKVNKEAICSFYEQQLFDTRDKTGILIYVSLLERQVIVLGDKGINSKVSTQDWDNVVNKVIQGIKQKKYTEGIISAIELCRKLLERYFPIKIDDTNELSNELVIKKI